MTFNNAIHKFKAGDLFHDRYTLEKLIGVGGFADVWRATDNKTGTIVALKIYTNLDEDGIADLSEEYTRMQGLSHTNILKAEHFDSWGNIPYLVMKFCDGGSLDKKVGKMSPQEITDAITQIVRGLVYLHGKGIVHQDIKPANILIDNTGGKPTYLLSDFGISSKSKTRLSHSVNLKSQGVSMTEAYAPPEKFSAKKEDRRPARKGDIFSFGISLYELITGSLPFDEIATGRQLQYDAVDIDFSGITDSKIRRIIELCMQRDKEARPSAEDLARILTSSDLPAAPVRNNDPSKRTRRISDGPTTSRRPLIILLIILAAIGIGLGVYYANIPTNEVEVTKEEAYKQRIDTFNINGVNLIMVEIPGGSFTMGCNDSIGDACERPAKNRQVATFYMSRFEITQKLWTAIMPSNPSTIVGDNGPVNNVSWEDCQLFISRLNSITGRNFRLSTEAEWEYAAKGQLQPDGTVSETSYLYAGSNNADECGWYAGNSGGNLYDVGGLLPNGLGLYDMSGNVIEWCQDIYTNYGTGVPEINKTHRVLRGGWYSGAKDNMRNTCRGSCVSTTANPCFGFRVCL